MSDIFNYFKNIFSGNQGKAQPFTHELLKRSETEIESYLLWKDSEEFENTIALQRYNLLNTERGNEAPSPGFTVIGSNTTSGIVIEYLESHYSALEFVCLFDYYKEKVLELGYRPYTSDVKKYVREKFVETYERHYIKPGLKVWEDTGRVDQLYGNITIEHYIRDEDPIHIKLYTHFYSDRNYTEVKPFQGLLEKILTY